MKIDQKMPFDKKNSIKKSIVLSILKSPLGLENSSNMVQNIIATCI
jgi:hypothetical protein